MDAVERIEVAIRATISNTASVKYGSHWFLDQQYFDAEFNHNMFLQQIESILAKDQPETFIQHYKNNYNDPECPPSWMIFEVLSLGTVSLIYKYLKLELKKEVASRFLVDYKILQSWLHSLSYLRNLCAHHSRIWNRNFTIKPKILNRVKDYIPENHHFFAQTFVIIRLLRLLRKISKDSHWEERLNSLLNEYSENV